MILSIDENAGIGVARTWVRALMWLAVASVGTGCSASIKARSADQYRDDTKSLLSDNSSKFDACYAKALKQDPQAAGTVGVSFEVAADSGAVENAKALSESTAPESLQKCVTSAMEGLQLAPGDERTGQGKLWFEFKAG
jgi:hypothetical protein